MYPKSPFKEDTKRFVYSTCRDDRVLHFNVQTISCPHTKIVFLKIRGNLEKINEQLYNLRISKQRLMQNENCSTESMINMKDVLSKLKVIKQTLRTRAIAIMEKYKHKDDIAKKSYIGK